MPDHKFKDLELLLKEVRRYAFPAKEPTLFAVGGRGYYENPASDLLAFFLKPDAEHELGDLFLSTYLGCIKQDHLQFKMKDVRIEREVVTKERSRIDLQIQGPDWCLLIENKIYHSDANPFPHYEAHAKLLGKEKTIFSILSPDGHGKEEGWSGVSYKLYCQALRERMAAILFDSPFSKWQLFAREFILHMENELYNLPMTPEQVSFVERHEDQIAEVQKLAAQYRSFILQELKRRLEDSVPGNTFAIRETVWRDVALVFRCTSSQWGNDDVVLFKGEGAGQKFFIRAYLGDVSEPRLSNTKHALEHMKYNNVDQYPYWTSPTGYDSRGEAIDELCNLAKKLIPTAILGSAR